MRDLIARRRRIRRERERIRRLLKHVDERDRAERGRSELRDRRLVHGDAGAHKRDGLDGIGAATTLITPFTSRRLPLVTVSLVAALPPSSVSCVSVGSSVNVITVPGVADGASVTVRCPTRLPGAPPLSVNGIRFVVS